jgi:hypothetical protein
VFDSYYQLNKVGVDKAHNKKYLIEVITYSFKSDRNYYLVEVELYRYDIYIIKFFLKKDKRNKLKYNVLTSENRCSKIISTCVRIMLQIHEKNLLASFGFLGANTIKKEIGYNEPKEMTKRFQVYKKAMYALLGIKTFTHYYDADNSTYLMINNKCKSVEGSFNNAKKMFEEIYPALTE